MINLYFKRHEFLCKGNALGICDCGFDSIDSDTLDLITAARIYFDNPYHINSGCRCIIYNTHIGGSENSQHIYARAIDGWIENIVLEMLFLFLSDKLNGKGGLGMYEDFVHVDTRSKNPTRW